MQGLYTTLSGAMALEQRLDMVAHDLANVNTPGHKRTRVVTEAEYPTILSGLIHNSDPAQWSTDAPTGVPLGDRILTRVADTRIDFSQGQLQPTGSPTNLALDGPGFFVVNVDGQDFYSRSGAFELNEAGELGMRVADGWGAVQSDGGAIAVSSSNFRVGADGSVTDHAGNALGNLRIVDFAAPEQLQRQGYTLFSADESAGLTDVAPEQRRVQQGMLEMSNADPISSLVEMIEIQRAHQAVSKAMQSIDEATGRRISAVMR